MVCQRRQRRPLDAALPGTLLPVPAGQWHNRQIPHQSCAPQNADGGGASTISSSRGSLHKIFNPVCDSLISLPYSQVARTQRCCCPFYSFILSTCSGSFCPADRAAAPQPRQFFCAEVAQGRSGRSSNPGAALPLPAFFTPPVIFRSGQGAAPAVDNHKPAALQGQRDIFVLQSGNRAAGHDRSLRQRQIDHHPQRTQYIHFRLPAEHGQLPPFQL